jgi:hypothetical protein
LDFVIQALNGMGKELFGVTYTLRGGLVLLLQDVVLIALCAELTGCLFVIDELVVVGFDSRALGELVF